MHPLFLNLSNHPSAAWSPEQFRAAEALGEVTDMPFPAVSPEADEAYVQSLAYDYCRQIMQMNKEQPVIVHVMGEMTFCFALVVHLKEVGIPCVASTTLRKTQTTPDGRKISEFHFCRFRQY